MTRKDYQLFANCLRIALKSNYNPDIHTEDYKDGFSMAVFAIIDALARDNERFNPEIFLEWVGKIKESGHGC